MRKIDIFNHIYPPKYYERLMQVAPDYKDIGKRMRGIPMLADLDVRFRVMDTFDEYQQVLSLPTPPIEIFARDADAADLARAANDGMAELVARIDARRGLLLSRRRFARLRRRHGATGRFRAHQGRTLTGFIVGPLVVIWWETRDDAL